MKQAGLLNIVNYIF